MELTSASASAENGASIGGLMTDGNLRDYRDCVGVPYQRCNQQPKPGQVYGRSWYLESSMESGGRC